MRCAALAPSEALTPLSRSHSDLGFLSSSCPTVRLTASLVILRLLFNSPPTSTVHNITPTELTKLASSMVAAECSGDCIGFFVSVGGLSTTWGMLRVSDYEVVMAGVKTLLYVVQVRREGSGAVPTTEGFDDDI